MKSHPLVIGNKCHLTRRPCFKAFYLEPSARISPRRSGAGNSYSAGTIQLALRRKTVLEGFYYLSWSFLFVLDSVWNCELLRIPFGARETCVAHMYNGRASRQDSPAPAGLPQTQWRFGFVAAQITINMYKLVRMHGDTSCDRRRFLFAPN